MGDYPTLFVLKQIKSKGTCLLLLFYISVTAGSSSLYLNLKKTYGILVYKGRKIFFTSFTGM